MLDPDDAKREAWIRRMNFFVQVGLFSVEIVALALVGTACLLAWIHYGVATDWTFFGILHVVHTNWIGAVVLSVALFYRTLHELLSRIKRVRVPGIDLPPARPTVVPRPRRAKPPQGVL